MKSKEEQLKALKKANKAYKLKLAQKAGYSTVMGYENYLLNNTVLATGTIVKRPKTTPKIKPTINIVDILDASSSMSGGKYNNSCEGIRTGLRELKNNKDVNYTYSLIEFVDSRQIITHNFLSELPNNIYFNGARGGDTPLYHTVLTTINRLLGAVDKNSKVLVKVFTDGQDNALRGNARPLAILIKNVEALNFTVTFVATDVDMKGILRDLDLEESNTLAVEDNAQGFERAFKMSNMATASYSMSVSKGEDVSKGFYKKVVGKL